MLTVKLLQQKHCNIKKLEERVKTLVKAAHIKHSLLIKGLHMGESYFYKVLNGSRRFRFLYDCNSLCHHGV